MNPPLQGIRIVEFEGLGPGPLAGRMLADMGAEVTVIARRQRTAVADQLGGSKPSPLRRGKNIVPLNLKQPDDLAEAMRLVDAAAGLIEGNRPGVMERLGLGPADCAARNPALVYGRMTGWGQTGPLAQAGMVAPEFQITNETSIAGSLNTFKYLFDSEGYGWDDSCRLSLNVQPWHALATQPEALVNRMDLMLCNGQMGAVTRQRLLTLIRALPAEDWGIPERIKQSFTVLSASPDFVVQK